MIMPGGMERFVIMRQLRMWPTETKLSGRRRERAWLRLIPSFRPPTSIGRAVRTGQHHRVTIRIAQPDLPMIGTALTLGRIAVARQNHFCLQLRRARNRRIEIGGLKPQENAVAMWEMRVTHGSVMMLDIPPMQLQDQLAV